MTEPAVLIVPGLRDHVADHWQTHLQASLPNARSVPPLETDKLSLAARITAISRTLSEMEGPVVIVAHSAGAIMTVHWALTNTRPIQGALLACPPDIERSMPAGYPTLTDLDAGGWLPVPRLPLPFPSLVLGSQSDPLARIDRIQTLAETWGSRFVNLGDVGHLNPASGHGPWPEALSYLRQLAV